MSSFHLEIIASQLIPAFVSYYRNNNQAITYSNLITDFFAFAPKYLTPSQIPLSNSRQLFSNEQSALVQSFSNISDYCVKVAQQMVLSRN